MSAEGMSGFERMSSHRGHKTEMASTIGFSTIRYASRAAGQRILRHSINHHSFIAD
jgi:hypothetical protein